MQFRKLIVAGAVLMAAASCTKSDSNAIKLTGSDTMLDLCNRWKEAYEKKEKSVSLQVTGGGSGVGIAQLTNGTVQIAPSSRQMTEEEKKTFKDKHNGIEAKEFQVGLDCLAIYVNKDNPIESISIPELAEIFGEGGKTEKWSDLGVENKACADGVMIPVSRQNSSGTYKYFQEVVLGKKRNYRQGINQQSGSADIAKFCETTPCAIGYSGMAYKTPGVKLLKVAKTKDDTPVAPSVAAALDKSYPISRPLYLYTVGEPTGDVKKFIDWCLSDEGQKVVEVSGCVPNPKDEPAK